MIRGFVVSCGLHGVVAAALLVSMALVATNAHSAPVAIEDFLRAAEFDDVRLSFDGKLLAITINKPDRHSVAFDRLEDAGKAPEIVVIEDKEGHGFYDLDNNAALYPKMLAFFEKYIGKGATAPAAP